MNDEVLPRLVLEGEGTLRRILIGWRRLIIEEERGLRVVVRSFIAEGRRFAETEEGRQWLEALSRSEVIGRGRVLWDLYSSGRDQGEPDMTPSQWLWALLDALKSPEFGREVATE